MKVIVSLSPAKLDGVVHKKFTVTVCESIGQEGKYFIVRQTIKCESWSPDGLTRWDFERAREEARLDWAKRRYEAEQKGIKFNEAPKVQGGFTVRKDRTVGLYSFPEGREIDEVITKFLLWLPEHAHEFHLVEK